jgi:hypothetical protein
MNRPDAVDLAVEFVGSWPSGPSMDAWVGVLLLVDVEVAGRAWSELLGSGRVPSLVDFELVCRQLSTGIDVEAPAPGTSAYRRVLSRSDRARLLSEGIEQGRAQLESIRARAS